MNTTTNSSSVVFSKITKMGDVETILPGFKGIWEEIKRIAGAPGFRCPKTVVFTTRPSRVYLDDGAHGSRFALNLRTMEISDETLSISSGEWACHGGSNNDQEVRDIPEGMALVTCDVHRYYRTFHMTLQINPANMPKGMMASTTS